MRKLVDLNGRIAVITWWQKNIFQDKDESRYRELVMYGAGTDVEVEERKLLEKTLGDVTVRIEKIEIALMNPIETNSMPTSFQISGSELILIQNAIIELQVEYKGKTISMAEGIEIFY